jgi:hypothetical protein
VSWRGAPSYDRRSHDGRDGDSEFWAYEDRQIATIGLNADIRTLLSGGRPLLILVVATVLFIILQNLTGVGVGGAEESDIRTCHTVRSPARNAPAHERR